MACLDGKKNVGEVESSCWSRFQRFLDELRKGERRPFGGGTSACQLIVPAVRRFTPSSRSSLAQCFVSLCTILFSLHRASSGPSSWSPSSEDKVGVSIPILHDAVSNREIPSAFLRSAVLPRLLREGRGLFSNIASTIRSVPNGCHEHPRSTSDLAWSKYIFDNLCHLPCRKRTLQ